MSRFFGPIRQNGYVVGDLDAAIKQWTDLGVGPFFRVDHVPLERFVYDGEPTAPDLCIAVANFGDLQIELVHQVNDAPSPYRDYRRQKGSGLQHVSVWSEDFDADMTRLAGDGRVPDCEGAIAGFARFAYFGSKNLDGTVMEIADLNGSPELATLFEHVRRSAVGWDGADPVRNLF